MGTKNNPGNFDCYENADPDEPMFVLLARDKHAPTLVWLWAALRELDQEDETKVAEARKCCEDMLAWGFDNNKESIGLGTSVLIGVMELIRAINARQSEKPTNNQTDVDIIRNYLSSEKFPPVNETK